MFIEIPYKTGDTVSLKLISGEEIVARLEDESETHITLHKPLQIMMGPQGFGLAPFVMSNPEAKVKLRATSVNAIVKTSDMIAKQYVKQTTGLDI